MADKNREELLEYYIDNFCKVSGEDKNKFKAYYTGFGMIRIMQALGAFGFRGLYEKKPTFTDSIIPGVTLLNQLIDSAEDHVKLPELYRTVRTIHGTQMFMNLIEGKK